jgi:hypothetical protein
MEAQRGSRDVDLLGDRQGRVVTATVWSPDPRKRFGTHYTK